MVISQPQNNPSYYYRALPTFHLNYSELTKTPYVLYVQCSIRVTRRNGAIKHVFTRIRSTEDHQPDCSLFILSLHALHLHLAVKILLRLSV